MTRWSTRSALNAGLNTIAQARQTAPADLIDLTRANPTQMGLHWPPALLADILGRAFTDQGAHRYAPSPFGLPDARAAVAASLTARAGAPVAADQVVLTASTSEAYAFLFKVLCDAGDRVLALAPSYPLFEHLARLEGVALDQAPLAYDGGWHLDITAVRAALTPSTRAILVVHPNNPTGTFLSAGEIDALAALGLPLIVDEVFGRYAWDAAPAVPSILARPDVASIALGGLSKRCGLPQMKAGWLVANGPASFRAALLGRLECVCDAFLSISTPVQAALPALLSDPAGIAAAILARVLRNRAALDRALVDQPLNRLHAQGGWYAMLAVPRTRTETQWVMRGIAAGVAVQPGWFYDAPRDGLLVLSLLAPPPDFDVGIERLVAAVAADEQPY
ncbi:MAG: alanine-synthesizing transaminase [Bradymonadia bacterium]|jgi:alanine-synthesizing transaminase